jgi:hypothetical protein
VDLHPDDNEKIAFSMSQELWQFTAMPIAICDPEQRLSA